MPEAAVEAVQVMDAEDIRRALTRVAHEIVERNRGARELVLVGILRKGAPVAERLARLIAQFEAVEVPVGSLDVTLYRDDALRRPHTVYRSALTHDVNDRVVVLVDEVFFTGRTIRSAMDAVMDL